MKHLFIPFILTMILIVDTYGQKHQDSIQFLLPEIIGQFPAVRDLALTPDGGEMYFTIQGYGGIPSAIATIKRENGKWGEPKIAIFSGQYHDLEPFVSSDGLQLYFASNRPLHPDSLQPKDFDIWYVERKSPIHQWSEPVNMDSPVNTKGNEFYPSLSANGNLYFTSNAPGTKGMDDIFVCQYKENQYQKPYSLSDSINTAGYEFNAYIAPDESFLIFSGYNRSDGFGSGDLYISMKNSNDKWQKAKNMGQIINSQQMDYCPYVDIRNNVLYFTSKRSSVKSFFSDKLLLDEFLKAMKRYDNGLSRIYLVEFMKEMFYKN